MFECTICKPEISEAVVMRHYRTGNVYACNPCAVYLDDIVAEIGSPDFEQELHTACG